MPKREENAVIRQDRDLVRTSKQLCDVSWERIEHGKRMRDELDERTSWAEIAHRKALRKMSMRLCIENA
jgi:hypothetical protein